MQRASAAVLPDGRLHLHHGPIDLILGVDGPGRDAALLRACTRFETVLDELAVELAELRRPVTEDPKLTGPVARRMLAAVQPFAPDFITPMAAVAGAVADEILAACKGEGVTRIHANNGGDVALWLAEGQALRAAVFAPVPATMEIQPGDRIGGVATSGRGGRSQSLGIADSVTVLAKTAALADAAATMIANAVDLPGHPAVRRRPACELSPDSDLGTRPVTVHVGPLSSEEAARALDAGLTHAERLRRGGLIQGAVLVLGRDHRVSGILPVAAEAVV
ncbi:UPF0280 family protein [Halovulum sp. GXIMD14794]